MIETLFVVIAIAAALYIADRRRRGRPATLHTKRPDDQTINGVLLRRWPEFVLVEAAYVTSAGKTSIPDRVRVPRANVSWWQEH